MPHDPLFWLLQTNDSSYPSGSYAHSFGLEEMVEAGLVKNAADLEQFLEKQIVPALLTFEIPMFLRAHRSACLAELENLLALDAELDGWRLPFEIREGSRRIGSQRLQLLDDLLEIPWVTSFRKRRPRAHHLIVSAIELSAILEADAARAFAYQAVGSLIAASMKLIRIGQNACQQILRRILVLLGNQMETALCSEPLGWFNPILEISALRHERSYARLFIS